MTQEDRDLYLKDLCARLPYHPKAEITFGKIKEIKIFDSKHLFGPPYTSRKPKTYEVKLFLRPMSSMTEDENKEAKENGCIIYCDTSPEDKGLLVFASPKGFDWLNKKMFDYRKDDEGKTMIEKGLALEASKGMYNNDTRRI